MNPDYSTNPPQTPVPPLTSPNAPLEGKPKKRGIITWIIFISLLALASLGGYFFATNKEASAPFSNVILAGIGDEGVNAKLNELLNAKHIISYKGKARLTDLPNYSERRKTLDMILQLMDLYPSKKIEKKQSGVNLDIVLDKLPPKEISNMLKELTKRGG